MSNKLIEKYSERFSSYSSSVIVIFGTIIIVISAVVLAYIFVMLLGAQYTNIIFIVSVIVPSLISPLAIIIIIRLSKYLKHFKHELEKKIESNKKKDILLFEQARFALMGEMMANISHQWKQPLNTIGLSVVLLRTSDRTEDEMDKHFDMMEDNIGYLATTIDDFMSFFDKKTHLEIRELSYIVKEIKSIVGTQISNRKIELEITVDDSYGSVKVSSSISQVILNLLNNAKDSFEADSERKEIKLQFTSNEYGLEIECCDNGRGIDENIKDKIFDPYFSTKEKKQGIGIGLYMSKEIIQKIFNGQINLSSREYSRSSRYPSDNSGKTCFYIAVPYSENCILKKDSYYVK